MIEAYLRDERHESTSLSGEAMGGWAGGTMRLWESPEGKWTITMTRGELTCVIATGEGMHRQGGLFIPTGKVS